MSQATGEAELPARTGNPVESPVLRYRFRPSREDDVLRIEFWVDPGGGDLRHFHPRLQERWEVIDGEFTFWVGGDRRTYGPGGSVVIEPGVRHMFRNTASTVGRFMMEYRPPGAMQEFLEEVAALGREGKYTRRLLPKSPGALLELSEASDRYSGDVVRADWLLPPALQRVLVPPLARLQRWRQRRQG